MREFVKNSKDGKVSEALAGLTDPKLIMMFVGNADAFDADVEELEKAFPGVPSVACIANAYGQEMYPDGLSIIAFTDGVEVATGVLKEVSTAPVKYMKEMEDKIRQLKPGTDNTVCIDFCTGNDACVLTTVHSLLQKHHIALTGGTGDAGKVAVDGQVYEDADAYILVKNLRGKIKVYKENIYRPMEGYRFIASDTDRSRYYVGKLNGMSAKQVYMDVLGIPESDIQTATFTNPFGKLSGKDVCIISLKGVEGPGLTCYRQVNDSDVLSLLAIRDTTEIAHETIAKIKKDFDKISGVFSINCAFRYIYFNDHGSMNSYLKLMNELSGHCGYVGYGEHYNEQFVNQSMSCVVFE